MQPISFRYLSGFSKELAYNKQQYIDFLIHLCTLYDKQVAYICIILVSDKKLLRLNNQYLAHDTYTDILTFFYMNEGEDIFSDIFISKDRLQENAVKYDVSIEKEFLRLCIHGILHLCGYKDKTPQEKRIMRKKENKYIQLFEDKFRR